MMDHDANAQLRKRQIRDEVQTVLAAIDPDDAAAYSDRICLHLQEWPPYIAARVVMLYSPIPTEPDILDLVSAAAASGKRLCAPRTDWQSRRLRPAMVNNWAGDLVAARYGVFEPHPDCAPVPIGEIDVVIVPGVAFDRTGRRLGRGGGLYDRFLAEPELRAATCGVCFAAALLPDLPCQPHDARVQAVCTEQGLIQAAPPAT
mgnify:CR=1 FL=1